jgi:L-seryl-tRNA(Ser) seleniumtransferase
MAIRKALRQLAPPLSREMTEARRKIPSVDKVLRELEQVQLPRPALVALIRRELARVRKSNGIADAIVEIRSAIEDLLRARIQPVINGTGVIIHTNLGRSPLAPEVVDALSQIASNYNNLEYDLGNGKRGSRGDYLEHNLAILCGAEAATVVNNCAAALMLILRHFTAGERKQIIISRGELVQIGGGFRIPEILEASGALLKEVGTTNKTSLADYSRAISKQTAMILKVHRSNFHMSGFVDEPATEELAGLAHRKRIPFVEDLGSGAIHNTAEIPGVEHEPTPTEILRKGVDLVCFSGDKLFSGPQAGVIAGKTKLVAALKREPFYRALRCDKLILAAMETVVDMHLRGSLANPIDVMMRTRIDVLRDRASAIVNAMTGLPLKASVGMGKSQVGGGTLPQSSIESITLDIVPHEMALPDLATRMRSSAVPVIGYISGGRFRLDLRTIFPQQDQQVIAALRGVFTPAVLSD